MLVLFPPDFGQFQVERCGNISSSYIFHTQLCWPFLMNFVTKICIKCANFHNYIFLGERLWAPFRDKPFSLWCPMNAYYDGVFIFHAHLNCTWNFNKIVMYQIYAWNFLNTKEIYKRYLPIIGKHFGIVPVYKNGNKLDPGNYGSISDLSNIQIFCWKKDGV